MKAKDLRGKNIQDIEEDSGEEGKEEDAVTAAYENISKKLESIRAGRDSEESKESEESKGSDKEEVELEEWKGPRKPVLEVEEEEEVDLRKVKLRNLEDSDEESKSRSDDDEDEIDPLDDEDSDEVSKEGKVSGVSKGEKKGWEPAENDPLDEDVEEESKVTEESEESEESGESKVSGGLEEDEVESGRETKRQRDDFESDNLERPGVIGEDSDESEESDESEGSEESEGSKVSEVFDNGTAVQSFESEREISEPEEKLEQPDTLDDLAAHDFKEGRTIKDIAEEDDYFIPNLKSGQREGSLSYNAHPQREGLGESYSPKGNMDGNDPNNYFSQHQQPSQTPKRANKFHLLILVAIGIAVIGFTVYILKGGFGDINIGTPAPSPSPSATATPEPTPTPTPEPTVDRGEFTVKVLNGTPTTGLAGTIRDKLKELGYKTAAPGNAADSDVSQTEIRVKEGTASAELLQRLTLDLAPTYEAKEGEKLDKKAAYDAEVIIGTK